MYLFELVGEDDPFSIAEASMFAAGVESIAPGVASAEAIDLAGLFRLARVRRVSEQLTVVDGAIDDLRASINAVDIDRGGSVAVRARDVRSTTGIDTQSVERIVGATLVERGLEVDLEQPAHELRVLATPRDGAVRWFVGWLVLEPIRSYGAREPPNRPFRQPGTMGPQLARTLVNLSGIEPRQRFLDPMCGPGGLLIEAALVGASVVGIDYQRRMVNGARENLDELAPGREAALIEGSAAALPVSIADAAVFDAPYGRQSPIGHDSARELVRSTLIELASVVDRCVAVFDAPLDDLTHETGWAVEATFERPVHRSLIRHVTILERPTM